MKLVTTHSDTIGSILYDKAFSFVQELYVLDSNNSALSNMGLDSESGFLRNIVDKTRWTEGQGEIAFLFSDSDRLIGISCVEHSLHPKISIGGIRTWILKEYRNKNVITNLLLNSNLAWSTERNQAGMLLTFNDHNKWIYEGIKRKVNRRGAGLAKIWSDWWNDCIVVENTIRVRYVDQWCVIKPTGNCTTEELNKMIGSINDLSV